VFVVNPCDYLSRVYDYSPLWLTLAVFPMTLGWLQPIGFGLDVAFLASLLLLPAGRTRRDVALIAFGVVSSATVYAVERGNNDLVIFILAAGAVTLACRSPALRIVGYLLALLAGLLKYYPMTLMALVTRERPRRFFAVAAGSIALVALFVAIAGHDLARALRLIPTGPYFSDMFGSITVAGGLTELVGWPVFIGSALRGAMIFAAILIGVRLGRREGVMADVERLSERERSFLLAGILLTLGCFFHGAEHRLPRGQPRSRLTRDGRPAPHRAQEALWLGSGGNSRTAMVAGLAARASARGHPTRRSRAKHCDPGRLDRTRGIVVVADNATCRPADRSAVTV
jgi:hypothetical protein